MSFYGMGNYIPNLNNAKNSAFQRFQNFNQAGRVFLNNVHNSAFRRFRSFNRAGHTLLNKVDDSAFRHFQTLNQTEPTFLDNIENLVFQGGGVRGVAYLGALEVLADKMATSRLNLNSIKRVCGASAGAICSLLLSLGYGLEDLSKIMKEMDLLSLLDNGDAVGGFDLQQTLVVLYELYNEFVKPKGYDIYLMRITEDDLKVDALYLMCINGDAKLPDLSSRAADKLPVLVKKGEEIHIYYKKTDGSFDYTQLDSSKLSIEFPKVDQAEIKLDKSAISMEDSHEILSTIGNAYLKLNRDLNARMLDKLPVLLKLDSEVFICGKKTDDYLDVTELDAAKFENLSFPETGKDEIKLDKTAIPATAYDEITLKKAHFQTEKTELTLTDYGVFFLYKYLLTTGIDWCKANSATIKKYAKDILDHFSGLQYLRIPFTEYSLENWLISTINQFAQDNSEGVIENVFNIAIKKIIEKYDVNNIKKVADVFNKYFVENGTGSLDDFVLSVNRIFNDTIKNVGIFSGEAFLSWIGDKIQTKLGELEGKKIDPRITFEALHVIAQHHNLPDLYVVAVNLTTGRTRVFSHLDSPNVFVGDAVRVSMSIPYFFRPYRLRYLDDNKNEVQSADLWTDGGVNDNYPIWVFDHEGTHNPKTLGLRLVTSEIKESLEKGVRSTTCKYKYDVGFWGYSWALLIGTAFDKQESDFALSSNIRRTVLIDTLDVGTVDFALDPVNKDRLIQSGREGAKSFLKNRYAYEDLKKQESILYSARTILSVGLVTALPLGLVFLLHPHFSYNDRLPGGFIHGVYAGCLSTAVTGTALMLPSNRYSFFNVSKQKATLNPLKISIQTGGGAAILCFLSGLFICKELKLKPDTGVLTYSIKIGLLTGALNYFFTCWRNKYVAQKQAELDEGWKPCLRL